MTEDKKDKNLIAECFEKHTVGIVTGFSVGPRPPADPDYPADAVQCDLCGGWGCRNCGNRGWLEAGHPDGRRCERPGCDNPIPPNQLAVYCSIECAERDA